MMTPWSKASTCFQTAIHSRVSCCWSAKPAMKAVQARLKEVLINATLSNVQIYSVDISQVAVRLNEKQDNPYPAPMWTSRTRIFPWVLRARPPLGTVLRDVESRPVCPCFSRKSSSIPKASS